MASPFAFVTLVSSDAYLPGALTQVAALRDLHTDGDHLDAVYVCLVTPESVDVSTIKLLRKAFDLVVGVEILEDANERRGLQLLGRPDLNTVLTKLHVFRLTQFQKIIFLDADVLPLRPLDHLFQLPHEFSAAPDVGWPDIFNSGVMVLTPGEDKFNELNELSKSKGSWDGGDQGLLNEWRGNDWNRLSFTYNTTPTAAYTYAPAYERFGSQISALHFIGRNKPWNSLPYRAPFTTNSLSVDPSQQAYDYDSLVDRWYAVYDKHYRSQSNQDNSSFEFQNYTSAWDQPAAADTIDLDGLKQFAIEGIASSANASRSTSSGEGKYISMPLDGRVDLMRPRKQREESERDDDPATPRMRPADFQWDPLPTPLPHEVPPSPQLMPVALPPGTPHRFEPVRSDFYASESESEAKREGLSQEPHSHEGAPLFRSHAEGSASPLQLTHPRPPRSGTHTPRRSRASSLSHTHPAASQAQQQHRGKQPNRQVSPTHVPWDASREPPPKNTPATNGFPPNTYFPNRWDQSSTPNSHSPANEPSSALFVPLPPPEIPEPLIRQGHYRNVTGEEHTPSPDRTKVKTVFPWEQKPRTQPRRIFPEPEGSNPPGLFLSPGSTSQTSTAAPSTPEQPKVNGIARGHVSSPLFALPSSLTYTNAWDTVPSIQKYATKLIRPPQAPQLAPAFDDERWRQPRRSWDERLEGGSRDGDGDNADDEDESDEDDEDTKWDDSDTESVGPPSRTPASPRIVSKGKREYRDQAVQATPDVQDQGVQVPDGTVISKRIRRPSKRISIPSAGNFLVPPQKRDAAISAGLESSASATTATVVPKRPRSVRAMSSASASSSPVIAPQLGSPMRSPVREFMVPSSPDGTEYPPRHDPEPTPRSFKPAPHLSHSPRTSPSVSRHASNDSSVTSPAESSGAQTPVADGPANGSLRQSGRVWDPARGVEIFKRGSEEVLARFLRMGSWENDSVR